MTINTHERIVPLVEREEALLIRQFPRHAQRIRDAVAEFRLLFEERIFADVAELAAFCPDIDQMDSMRNLPAELVEPMRESRRRILAEVSCEVFRTQNATTEAIDPDQEIRTRERYMRRRGRRFSPEEINQRLQTIVQDYLRIASHIGEHETVQIMISVGVLRQQDAPGALSILRAYLGRCARAPGGGGPIDILGADDEILQFQSVRRVLQRMIRQQVYGTLLALGGDTMKGHERVLQRAGEEAQAVMENLARRAAVDPQRHTGLFQERRVYFQQAARLHLPDCFVDTVEHQGVQHPLPSWRQRIALMEAMRQQHVLIGYEPGLGKTFIPIWLYQFMRERRLREQKTPGKMLYIGPKVVMAELPNRIQPGRVRGIQAHSYYDHEHFAAEVPTVGVITEGMDLQAFEEQCAANIVFCPYTMLHQEKDDMRVSERLLSFRDPQTGESFTSTAFDECHNLKGDGAWTQCARDIIHRTPGLYQNGNVMFMSGTPATNTLGDLRVIAELLEPGGNVQRNGRRDQRRWGPALMRNMLERLVVLDPPEDWESHVIPFRYQLSIEDRRLLNAIVNDHTRHPRDKMDSCLRVIRSGQNLINNTTHLLEMFLNERHTVLIAENIHAQGVTREYRRGRDGEEQVDEEEEHAGNPIFRDRVIEYLEQWSQRTGIPYRFHVIDGENNKTPAQREVVFNQAQESDRTGETKTVILAHSSCLREGIDLRFIRRMITLQWPFNSPDLQQLLKRSLRAGNTDIEMVVFFAENTLEEGIYDYARDKYAEVRACIYEGTGFSDRRLQRMSQDEQEMSNVLRLLERVQSADQREELIGRILHSRGMRYHRRFWNRARNRQWFREKIERADTSGLGDPGRYIAGLIAELERAGVIEHGPYLHVHSQGLQLDRLLQRTSPCSQREVTSMDPLDFMLEDGRSALLRETRNGNATIVRGGLTHTLGYLRGGQLRRVSFNTVLIQDLECTHASSSEGQMHFNERTRALIGALRALRPGGTLVIIIPRDACTREEFENFCDNTLPQFGCEVVPGWTGEGRSTDVTDGSPFRMFTAVARKTADRKRDYLQENLTPASLQLTHRNWWGETRERSLLEGEERRSRLPYAPVHTAFRIGRHDFTIHTAPSIQTQAEQLAHLQELQTAASVIRQLAPTARDFAVLPRERRTTTLAQHGIAFLPQLPQARRRPAFRLTAYPDYLFYPYDQQWATE